AAPLAPSRAERSTSGGRSRRSRPAQLLLYAVRADVVRRGPGGHVATTVALGAAGYAVTGTAELAAGCFAGGFLIDLDHYLDYLTVEGQWRRPSPSEFLRYYFGHRYRRLVLPLHSMELVGAVAALAVG